MHITAILLGVFTPTGESSQTFTKSSQLHQASILNLVQNSHQRYRKPGTEKEMNNNIITHTTEIDSEIKNAAIGVFLKIRNLVQGLFGTIEQGMTEIDASHQDRQNKQQQVHRYSISSMDNLVKLRMGFYRD
jgi:hypothetical protein